MWPLTRSRPIQYALSIRQPWAGLVVNGLKSIEIRRWPTSLRGPVFIHAARLIDERPEAWRQVADTVKSLTDLRGGLIGTVELTGCITYPSLDLFLGDRQLHLNEPGWFVPGLFGFTMRQPRVVPFRPLKGQTLFFRVSEDE
jgi:hypothetical protein